MLEEGKKAAIPNAETLKTFCGAVQSYTNCVTYKLLS